MSCYGGNSITSWHIYMPVRLDVVQRMDSKAVDLWTAREDPCRSSLVISRDLIPTFLFSGLFL